MAQDHFARGQRHGVGVECPSVGDCSSPIGWVKEGHDVFAASKGSNGHTSADDLAQSGHIGHHAIELLGSACSHPEALHLVED